MSVYQLLKSMVLIYLFSVLIEKLFVFKNKQKT